MSTEQPADPQPGAQSAKRKAGRPRKWPQGPRRIPPIYEGRMSFQPGDAHPMNAQFEEARQLREAIGAQLAEVQALVVQLGELEDASVAVSREEAEIRAFVYEVYGDRKHRDHVYATLVLARRRRLFQRLRAAQACLEQARELLGADAALLPHLRQAVADAQASALWMHGPPPERPEAQESEVQASAVAIADPSPERPIEQASEDEAEEGEEPGDEQGGEDEVGPDQQERDPQAKDRHELLRTVGGGDDATRTREALAAFEERSRIIRNAITEGRGWFEWYYKPRPRIRTKEAKAYLARGEAVPEGVQEWEEDERPPWGPYLRFRMYEDGIQYQIGMGYIRRHDKQRPTEPPKL